MRAGFWKRIILSIADGVILQVVQTVMSLVTAGVMQFTFSEEQFRTFLQLTDKSTKQSLSWNMPGMELLLPAFAAFLPMFLIFILLSLFEVFFAGSPAKLIFGYRVRDVSGKVAGKQQLLLRYFCKYSAAYGGLLIAALTLLSLNYSIPAILIAIPGIFLMLFSLAMLLGILLAVGSHKQTLYDRIARTAVYPIRIRQSCTLDTHHKNQSLFSSHLPCPKRGTFDANVQLLGSPNYPR